MGPDAAADILDRLADAHMKLSEGQGAELLWRDSLQKTTRAARRPEVLRAQNFARFRSRALYTGLRLAGPVGDAVTERSGAWVTPFARNWALLSKFSTTSTIGAATITIR